MSSSSLGATTQDKTSTCKVCRQRKVRCDGEKPTCGPCSRGRKGFSPCEYLNPSVLASTELPKGAACIPCWKRKRKCDGNRPCQTCRNTDACQYRDKAPQVPVFKGVCGSAHLPLSSASASALASPDDAHLESAQNLSTDTRTCQEIDRAAELSSVRNVFLDQSWEYGLNISGQKRAAIASGDNSGAIVHPALNAVCELLGYVLACNAKSAAYEYLHGHWAAREKEQLARTLLLLDTTDTEADPLTHVQVFKLLAIYYARRKDFHRYNEYLGHAANVALRHQVLLGLGEDFSSMPLPPAPIGAGFPQGPIEEGRSALAHLVYLEVGGRLIRKHPPKLPAVMIAKFERLARDNLEETELNFLRAKTTIHLQESEQIAADWLVKERGSLLESDWAERWIALSKRLHTHILTVKTAIAHYTAFYPLITIILRSCIVVTLASLAVLHALFAPFHPFAWQKHSSLINSIAHVSRTFVPEDHQYFDCTLELCWDIASREISGPNEPAPEWKISLANAVFLVYDEPLELDVCTGSTVAYLSQVAQPLDL
ncbi:hypothetical protein C8R47DRAFT_1160212 [Mycena vitilis]|nr:hypothetical protein C8R47DRAFT_1160212 [Mycena vitilis]